MAVFCVVALCSLVEVYDVSEALAATNIWAIALMVETARGLLMALMTEAASTSEMLVNYCQTTWRYNSEHGYPQ
jgi:hypothetical protein